MELDGRHPPVTFVFFVQEELGLVGSKGMDPAALGDPAPSMCFNFDGHHVSEIEYSIAGVERLNINISGVSAHGGRPQHGISAAAIEARAVAALVEDGWHGEIRKSGKYGTSNLGVLRGGKGSNQVMPELYGLLEARSFDRDFRNRIIEEWKKRFEESVRYFNDNSSSESKAGVEFTPGPVYDPFTLEKDAPVVMAASEAIRQCGVQPELIEDMGGQDSNNIVAAGIPAVGLGTGCQNAHSKDEYVDVDDYEQCCRLAEILVVPC
jgi:tripeptide aminopeptidase